MTRDERPLAAVPSWVWFTLALALAAQIGSQIARPQAPHAASELPPPPAPGMLRLASFGEPAAAARLAMLYLQSFDLRAGNDIPYRDLDYGRLTGWLRAILATDPRSQYPLFAAARIYAEIPDPRKARAALEFVYQEFLKDPNRRWRWLAHAALLAKYRLKDLPLALRYASAVERLTTAPDVPVWAKQMRLFILEDMDELQAAKVMLGGLLASGQIKDPAELRFLKQHLEQLEARIMDKSSQPSAK
ncbi:MAG: hypothetical protein ACREU5_11865 [Burkholderiales bacterium]